MCLSHLSHKNNIFTHPQTPRHTHTHTPLPQHQVTDASLSLKKYRMVVFFSNDETDTQGGLWWRPATKELMIVFRGASNRRGSI